MIPDAEATWSTSLVTASSFIGLLVALIFGFLASLSGDGASLEYFGLGVVCAASFIAHLRI